MAFPLAATAAGLGLFAQDYLKKRQVDQQQELTRAALQDRQRENQARSALFGTLAGGGDDSFTTGAGDISSIGGGSRGPAGGGGAPAGPTPPPMQPPGPGGGLNLPGSSYMPQAPGSLQSDAGGQYRIPQSYGSEYADRVLLAPRGASQPQSRTQSGGDMGGGMRAGGALTRDNFLNLAEKYESGGRNVPNYRFDPGHTAQGNFQITNSTWRQAAPRAGVDLMQYPNAMSAPHDIQRKVASSVLDIQGPGAWTNYNPALRRAVGGGEQADPLFSEARQTVQTAAKTIDPAVMGRMSLQALARQIDKANPGADPIVKMMALEQGAKLLAPSESRIWQLLMQQHSEDFQRELAEKREQFQTQQADRTAARQEAHDTRLDARYQSRQAQTDLIADERIKRQGWDVLTDPSNNQQYRYNKQMGEARTLTDNQPYKPGGAAKVGPSGGAALNDTQATFWANVINQGGALPPGLRRSGVVEKIMAKVPGMEGANPGDFIARHAEVQANTTSLRNMQKMSDAAISFEKLAEKNFDVALKLAPDAVPTDLGPFFNRWIEEGETMLGDPSVPPYVAAMITGANEYAKVMSGSTGTAASTVDSRREARNLFSPYMSLPQIENVVAVAKADMKNRENTLNEQVGQIQGRLGSTKPTETAPPAQPKMRDRSGGAPPAAGAHKYSVGQIVDTPKGKVRVTGGDLDNDPEVEPVQ